MRWHDLYDDWPPIFDAAIPVLAVTDTASFCPVRLFRKADMIARRSKDFPVPVDSRLA